METATGTATETLEFKESIPKPAFYACLEGPASSGKSAVTFFLPEGLAYLLDIYPLTLPIYNLIEPPNWQAFTDAGLPTPYEIIRRQTLTDNYAQILALTAWRMMMWGSATLDGKPIDPGLHEILQHPQGIVIGDRSPMSMGPYQNVFPGSTFPEAASIFPLLYSSGKIPFPDSLYVIMPEPDAQRKRLEARLEKASGKLDDFGDDPQIQDDILTGYDKFLTVIRNWPGVYRLNSQAIVTPYALNLATVINLHIYTMLLEKGVYVKEPYNPWQQKHRGPFRIELNTTDVSAYVFSNLFESSRDVKYFGVPDELYARIERGMFVIVNYGDILLIFDSFRTILVTIESPDKITSEEAIQIVLAAYMQDARYCQSFSLITQNICYGTDLYGRYKCDRSWGNITW